jgi:magnesium transporter
MATLQGRGEARATSPRYRLIYRESAGALHLDWPLSRLAEALADAEGTLWLDIEDRHSDVAEVERLFREAFGFHPLAVEDALQEANVPKIDDWEQYLYVVFQTISFVPEGLELELHELDAFLGTNYLVTYRTDRMELVEAVRTLIERDGGSRLKLGPDHILYYLLDRAVAGYMPAIEHLDDQIDAAQEEALERPGRHTLERIMAVKRAALRLHRVLIPQREVLNRLARDEYPQVDARDQVYFRDVYDHMVRLHDVSETLRDLISGALETYFSAISNRTNEVMKALTVVTVLFLPLNFMVGFFGMNFFGDNIHLDTLRVSHTLAFGLILATMALGAWGMWAWARWRGWF